MPPPTFWGKRLWRFLFRLARLFDQRDKTKSKLKSNRPQFLWDALQGLGYLLPCGDCGTHFLSLLESSAKLPQSIELMSKNAWPLRGLWDWFYSVKTIISHRHNRPIRSKQECARVDAEDEESWMENVWWCLYTMARSFPYHTETKKINQVRNEFINESTNEDKTKTMDAIPIDHKKTVSNQEFKYNKEGKENKDSGVDAIPIPSKPDMNSNSIVFQKIQCWFDLITELFPSNIFDRQIASEFTLRAHDHESFWNFIFDWHQDFLARRNAENPIKLIEKNDSNTTLATAATPTNTMEILHLTSLYDIKGTMYVELSNWIQEEKTRQLLLKSQLEKESIIDNVNLVGVNSINSINPTQNLKGLPIVSTNNRGLMNIDEKTGMDGMPLQTIQPIQRIQPNQIVQAKNAKTSPLFQNQPPPSDPNEIKSNKQSGLTQKQSLALIISGSILVGFSLIIMIFCLYTICSRSESNNKSSTGSYERDQQIGKLDIGQSQNKSLMASAQ